MTPWAGDVYLYMSMRAGQTICNAFLVDRHICPMWISLQSKTVWVEINILYQSCPHRTFYLSMSKFLWYLCNWPYISLQNPLEKCRGITLWAHYLVSKHLPCWPVVFIGHAAKRSPRQVSMWVPCSAGNPTDFMDMPEAALASHPTWTSIELAIKSIGMKITGYSYSEVNK